MISIRGVSKRLGKVRALQAIDLEIATGEAVAIFGENGAGKSTLLKLVAGLLRPTTGSVLIDGADPRLSKAKIGYLGHEPLLYGYLSAAENLQLFADLYRVGRSKAPAALELVGMSAKSDSLVNELSQGERQRVALGRALLHDPHYLLLDEPFSSLDAAAADLAETLIRKSGRTVLLVTHDQDRGRAATGRSLTLDSGRLAGP